MCFLLKNSVYFNLVNITHFILMTLYIRNDYNKENILDASIENIQYIFHQHIFFITYDENIINM